MNRLVVSLLVSGVLLAAPTAGLAGPCRGDCDADGHVDVDELVLGVGVALGARPVAECSCLDSDQNGRIGIDEVLDAVADSLSGCERPAAPPNIVWIVAEDMNAEIGSFGDAVARTPNLDRLAAEGVRYTNVFSPSGVCAPSRAALITGMYPTSIGAHHMRTSDLGYETVPPPFVKAFTEYLRASGYYCINNGKTDYQFGGVFDGPFTIWDETSGNVSGRNRDPGQPFFAYFTLFSTHESQHFPRPDTVPDTDPDRIEVPPYYPDTPAVRAELARYYDNIATMDDQAGAILAQLGEDGLSESTIVIFFGDNGKGFPRDKRWAYDGGIHVPMIVRWPGQIEAGQVNEKLTSFIDFAPTMLSLAGLEVPQHMQGHVFLGAQAAPPRQYVFAATDRHDEATDRIRAVRDERYKYIRNYQPDTPYGQSIAFRNNLATMQEMFRLEEEGDLDPPADWYFRQTKPTEELYDVIADPFEIDDLAQLPEHLEVLTRMRAEHERWLVEYGDLGAIPEGDMIESMWPGGAQPETSAPVIEPAGGVFDDGVLIRITSETPGASIGYTLDEERPLRWKLYAGEFLLPASSRLRAKAIRYGFAESATVETTFEIR